MPKKLLVCAVAALSSLVLMLPLQAQESPAQGSAVEASSPAPQESIREQIAALEEKSRIAYEEGKWVSFYTVNMKLSQLLPYETDYLVNVVRACGQLDRKTTAYHYMLKLQQQGFSFDFDSLDDTIKIRDTEAYQYINTMLIQAGKPGGKGEPAFNLPGNPADYRAIAWDGSRNRFLIGSISDGALLSVSAGGQPEKLMKADDDNGIWSITGLAVDVESNRLWLSSTATPAFTGYTVADQGHSALFELDLETLKVLGRYNVPVDGLRHELGSLAVSGDGHVYVIDRVAPIVYHKTPESDRLEAFFAAVDMLGLNDIAVTADNSRLFISDPSAGILVIDPIARQASPLAVPETVNLDGISGIEFQQGFLFVIQGGFEPQRIMRLELDASGGAVKGFSAMAVGLDGFNGPGLATIEQGGLYYFANSDAAEDSDTVIMGTPLDASVESTQMNIEELTQSFKKKAQ